MEPLLAHKDQSLVSHLEGVSKKSESFAAPFGAAEQGKLAGVLHDLGKAEDEFQKRIHTEDHEGEKQPHAHHGAGYALRTCATPQWPVALAVNGHHAGLHNRGDVDQKAEQYRERARACLEKIQDSNPEFSIPAPQDMLPSWLSGLEFFPGNKGDGWLATDLFTRFLYSALVDADRLDTEENDEDGEKKKQGRRWEPFSPEILLDRLERELANRTEKAKAEGKASGQVMAVRQEVGSYCRDSASQDRGLFSLTVPTGGGKTLASMLFALHHAVHHNRDATMGKNFRRIIVVIPYLSIIQQTAKELRAIFAPDEAQKGRIVLEHHSQVEVEPEPAGKQKDKKEAEPSYDSISERRRLAAENWDAPIIVTTSVQFFESLFSRRPAKARKLHNIAQSIIIFDEIQTLPPLMLQPILHVLSELANPQRPYGCSMVFCTATQPALGKSEDLPTGLENVRPIVPVEKAREHFTSLKRVTYLWPEKKESISWEELAKLVLDQDAQQALIVVNTRKAARELHKTFRDQLGNDADGLFHLSTWMMPDHRLKVLEEVRRRLDPKNHKGNGRERCILVSTQCIEAGVDVDFPAVWRAFGPYDSMVQVAGRCNRNGLIGNPEEAIVRIFHPQNSSTPKGLYSTAIAQTELLRKMGLAVPDDPDSFTTYFRLLYQLSVPDECGIQRARSRLQFKEVDELFEFIEDNTYPVLILRESIDGKEGPTEANTIYETACSRFDSRRGKKGYFSRDEWRKIQPYIINLSQHSNAEQKEAIRWNMRPAFDKENSLFVWNGVYQGGLTGVGIDFDGPIPAERTII
jgi:CRISPR-associated endonuclease/helicase Cas3